MTGEEAAGKVMKSSRQTTVCHYRRIEGNYGRTIVCGDIHGCFDEMMELLNHINFCEDDVLICVGDLLDRGPKSWDVANFFRNTPNAFSVLGNHERRVAGVIRGTSSPAWTQEQTLSLIPHDLWKEWAKWLESLPAVIETGHALITHAQLDPQIDIQCQNSYLTAGVGRSGMQIKLDSNRIPTWFHETDFSKPVCIGHIQYDRPELIPGRLYALDDSCCFGGKLTAAIFPSGELVSIPAKRNYFEISKKQWFEQQYAKREPSTFTIDFAIDALKENSELSSIEEIMVSHISGYVEHLDIEARATILRKQLFDQFGPIPDKGSDRGRYFIHVKGHFPDAHLGMFAAKLLQKEITSLKHLKPIIRKGTLADIGELLSQFEREQATMGMPSHALPSSGEK